MKKITTLALAAMTLLPCTADAQGWTREVTNKSEFTDAINAIGSGVAGETYEIVLTYDVADVVNAGNIKPTIQTGRIVIRSNETDYDKMPVLQVGFDWQGDLTQGEQGKQFSMIFENVNLQYRSGNTATSGQVVYFNKRQAPCDTIAFRNCEITNIPRTLYRSVPKQVDGVDMIETIDVLELSNCRVHDMNISSGNNWFTLVVGQFINRLDIRNNIFYNMPYSKGVWQMSRVSDLGAEPIVNFENNSVFLASNKALCSSGYEVLQAGSALGALATYNINNNMFIAPQAGAEGLILKNDTTDYDGAAKLLNAKGGMVFANNNVIDPRGYQGWAADNYDAENGEKWTLYDITGDLTPEQVGITSWEAGVVFQDAPKSLYYMLTSSQANEAGVGSANTYVDAFPTPASISVTIDGPKYIDYTITPEKDVYYVGDEITLTLNDHNNYYRTFNTFNGWSDGNTETTRNITLEGDLNLTASFKEADGVLAAFDFSEITKNANISSYDADIYYNMDEAYKAVVKGYVNDTAQAAPYPIVEGNFQTRAAKFGEDAEELQMPIISRRTAAAAKATQHDYVVVEFNATGMSSINFSCFVGTDNNAAKAQTLSWSLDGSAWTEVASVEIENGKWSELKAELPEAVNNQEKVYVKILGDITKEAGFVYTTDPSGGLVDESGALDQAKYDAADAFEYVGNILITATGATGIEDITVSKNAADPDAPIYNLMGVKVKKATKGIFIQNGMKVIVK